MQWNSKKKTIVDEVPRVSGLAPWATPVMVQQRAEKLEQVIATMKEAGGCDGMISSLEKEVSAQIKKAASPVSVHVSDMQTSTPGSKKTFQLSK